MLANIFVKACLKPIKYFIDSHFRPKVTPVAGSVVYCDLYYLVEHSGIHVAQGEIANIVVTEFAQSQVKWSNAFDFTSKSVAKKIYVSCRNNQAVGHKAVANGAQKHIGETDFYGLIFKNCHQFASKCVSYAPEKDFELFHFGIIENELMGEPTFAELKSNAKKRLGVNQWLLWDWDKQAQNTPEPDWAQNNQLLREQALNAEFDKMLRHEFAQTKAYQQEIEQENIPKEIRQHLNDFANNLQAISDKYDEVKDFLKACPNATLSFNDLISVPIDVAKLGKELMKNQQIKDLLKKMGREYLSEKLKKRQKSPTASQSEIYGTHRSNDLMRILPSELVNIDDENLEMLFYARILEQNLQSYELQGSSMQDNYHQQTQQTGPIIACLDTSSSMEGKPLQKARALLFAIANVLQREKRSLHILLFSDSGQIQELNVNATTSSAKLLQFLAQEYGSGTDFTTPLNRSLEIIETQTDFNKADILMISDGGCSLSPEFVQSFKQRTEKLNCMMYSVLCHGKHEKDDLSDEVIVL